jgi:hypothetical protein
MTQENTGSVSRSEKNTQVRYLCFNNEKTFRTVWIELTQEFLEVFNHCVEQTLWNTGRDSEMQRPLIRAEMIHRQQGISHEKIAEDRLWNKRPDGIAFYVSETLGWSWRWNT